MLLRKRLAAIFSPTWRLIGPDPGTVREGGLLGEVQWVVPRARLGYRRHDFSALPARRRQGAAAIAGRREAPGPARLQVAWKGPVAHVWTWPEADAAAAGVPNDAVWMPESLLRAAPATDGPRLVRQADGFEGQHWRNGDLQASQWWSELPSARAWELFLRAGGLPATAASPEPVASPWSAPWADPRRGVPVSPAVLERWALRAVVASLALALGWQIAAEIRWRAAQSELDAHMAALREKASPLLSAREQAERDRAELEGLAGLQQATSDYQLVARVISPLPADTRLLEWRREGDRLQVALHSSDVDPRHFVSAYQEDARLGKLVATPGESGVTKLDFDLAGGAPAR